METPAWMLRLLTTEGASGRKRIDHIKLNVFDWRFGNAPYKVVWRNLAGPFRKNQ